MSPLPRLLALLSLPLLAPTAAAQVPPDQAADMLLTSARKAFNEKNYPFARDRFREFLQKFAGHREANDARYGLALALIDGPEKDYKAAVEALQAPAGAKDFADRPYALYYLGLSQRGLGTGELAQGAAKPQEMPQRRNQANQHFAEAAKQFAEASKAFAERVSPAGPAAKELPADMEWACRARCDQAEMQLRLLQVKEARATVEPFDKGPVLAKSKSRPLGLYYHGFACSLLGDLPPAGRSLNQLAPFNDPAFGTHARYLLARVHHQSNELAEAAAHYDGVLTDHAKQKASAAEALKQPERFKNDPAERARLESLIKTPPDHVARSAFFAASLAYEGGKFGDALTRFAEFGKQYPGSPLQPEVQLRVGYCQVQLKQYKEAVGTLQPVANSQPALADQALLWIGKAQAQDFDPANPQARDNALKAAVGTLRSAVAKAQELTRSDPEAKTRRAEILLELADVMQTAGQAKDAAGTYEQLLGEKLLPARSEELTHRLAAAYHLAGDYARSDQVCDQFRKAYPQSPLLPAVLFRAAENAYFAARDAEKKPDLPNRAAELGRMYDDAVKRYRLVAEKYPEFERVGLARYGLALACYRRGDYEKAREALEAVPAPDRTGELAAVPYLLADCLLRLAPTKADDALATGKLIEQLEAASAALDAFLGANPKAPEAPDALLKLGHAKQRLAAQLALPMEKAAAVAAARAAYEKLQQQFPQSPLVPAAVFERAKCLALAGDKNGATNELRRFTNPPLVSAPIAPMALIQLATLLREQNKAEEASQVLAACRQRDEPNLAKDLDRAEWVQLLKYHQAAALQEAGKLGEARGLFEQVAKEARDKAAAADAALRAGQCRLQEGRKAIDAARQKLAAPNLKPEEAPAATNQLNEGWKMVAEAGQSFERQAEAFKQALPTAEPRARMVYEAAWAYRLLADNEVRAATARMQEEQRKKLEAEALKKLPPGGKPPVIPPPEVARASVPVQPAEQKARDLYVVLLGFGDLPLTVDARLELAELFAEREELGPAVKLLQDAIDKEPPPELTAKVRLRLGACLAAQKKPDAALAQFDAVAADPKSPLAPQAHYRAGECLIALGQHAEAAKRLAKFRDEPPLQNVPGVSDRALLRLGHALAQAKQWDASRQAHETLVNRYGNSPWANEGRYGIGWAWQNAKQYDNAVNAYAQVANATATDLAAKAQLQIGLCRLEQKRYPEATTALLVVPFTYDFPELSAVALCEAARCFVEMKQPEQAAKLLERVIKDHPDSESAKAARERLAAIQKQG